MTNPTFDSPRDPRIDASARAERCGEMERRLVALSRRLSSAHYELCRLLSEYDRAGAWAFTGAATCSRWAADLLEVETSTAREWIRVGHALTELAEVDAAFSDGRLSFAKVRTLTRVATDHPDRQDELIRLAEQSTASSLSCELARWSSSEEDDEERDRRHRREMGLTMRTEPDGAGVISVRLPPLDAAAVMAALDTKMMAGTGRSRLRRPATEGAADATAVAASPPSVGSTLGRIADVDPAGSARPRAAADACTRDGLAKQRARALVELLTRPAANAGVATELLIHLRSDGATLSDGTPVAGHLVERLAPASFFRALVHDADARPINASGRQRHPTVRQQRVVAARYDHTCSEPGCRTTAFIEFDHDPPFAATRRTVIDELEPRCAKHHRDRHRKDVRQPRPGPP